MAIECLDFFDFRSYLEARQPRITVKRVWRILLGFESGEVQREERGFGVVSGF